MEAGVQEDVDVRVAELRIGVLPHLSKSDRLALVLDRERLDVVSPLRLRDQLFLRDARPPARDLRMRARGRERGGVIGPQRPQDDAFAVDRHAAIIGA